MYDAAVWRVDARTPQSDDALGQSSKLYAEEDLPSLGHGNAVCMSGLARDVASAFYILLR